MLLAKTPGRDRFFTTSLVEHTRDVVQAAHTLLRRRTAFLNAMGIEWGTRGGLLYDAVVLACWLHDLGKATDYFQDLLIGRQQDNSQPITHEIVSGVVAIDNDFREWLRGGKVDEATYYFAVAAAMGHHRRWSRDTKPSEFAVPLTICRSNEDFTRILEELGDTLGIAAVEQTSLRLKTNPDDDSLAYGEVLASMKRELRQWFGANVIADVDRKVLATAKALTISADVAASAVRGKHFRQMSDERFLPHFIDNLLDCGLVQDDLKKLIGRWAKANTGSSRLKPRPFQIAVAESESLLTFAQAGCGSGKSLAAYLWAQQRLKRSGEESIRVIFTLPTTGTATEHYRDYALESGIDESLQTISHSRAVVDLAYEDKGEEALREHRSRIESLELWGTALTTCTVDTVLGLLANQRKALYSFPAIMRSAIVFDEIHAYDDVMFGHLMVFLKTFTGIPVLLMTASLPPERLDAIRDIRPDLNVVHGDRSYEEMKRYSGVELTSPVVDGKMHIVEDRIRRYIELYPNCKILWVRNQVGWANDTYRACYDMFKDVADVDLYHSRYRYKDRVRIHRQVIDRFQKSPRPAILVATQVAEMSLNLSAHLLITDACDIPGAIQRMGRLNRGVDPLPAPAGWAVVCRVPSYTHNKLDCNPYTEQKINDCCRWAKDLSEQGALSQKDLSDSHERYRQPAQINLQDAENKAVFLSRTWETTIGEFRDWNPTATILLENDHNDFIAAGEGGGNGEAIRMWMREHETNVVSRPVVAQWRRYKGVPIAPNDAIVYGEIDDPQPQNRTGASWAV